MLTYVKITLVMAEKFTSGTRLGRQAIAQKDIAPDIYSMSKRKNRKLRDALADNKWIRILHNAQVSARTTIKQFVDHSVKEWWLYGMPSKDIKSLLLMVNSEIRKERNTRTSNRQEASPTMVLSKVKEEARAR